jgi:hypothetical protein
MMTTINSSSPASIWVQPQTASIENSQQVTKSDVKTSSASVSVNISDAAFALLNAESDSNEPLTETASSVNGNDVPPPLSNSVIPLNSGNDTPVKPPESPADGAVSPMNSGNDTPVKPPQ